MTKPLRTKNRSTPSAPAVTSGPSTPTAASTPSSGLKWKWNSTTQTAATIRSPVSVRNSAGRGATPSPERVVSREAGVAVVTIGATTDRHYARRATSELYPDAGDAHGAWRGGCGERVMYVAATPPAVRIRNDEQLPAVQVEHGLQRFARRGPERLARVVGRREEHALAHVRRDAEQRGDLALVAQVQRRPRGAEAAGTCGELVAPRRGQQRAPESGLVLRGEVRARLDARQHQDGDLAHVVGEVLRAVADACLGGAPVGVVVRRGRPARAVAIGLEGAPVVVAHTGPQLRIGDDHPVPALAVAPGGCLQGDLQALLHQLERHGPGQVEALADRARCGEQFVGPERERRHQSVIYLFAQPRTPTTPPTPARVSGARRGTAPATEPPGRRLSGCSDGRRARSTARRCPRAARGTRGRPAGPASRRAAGD